MSTQELVKNQVMNGDSTLMPVEQMVKNAVQTLHEALPAHMNAERLVRIALTTLRLNPKLYKCTPDSFMGALFQSAQLGLEPNIEGQAYIIPVNNKKQINGEWKTIPEAQFQIGYKGYVELFYRHQNSVSLHFDKVRDGDEFSYQYGTSASLTHVPSWDTGGEARFYYAVAKLKNGGTVFKVMSKEECIEHGKQHSKCFDKKNEEFYKNTPWAKDTDSMCMKTVLIQLMKLLPKSIEIQRAISADETIKIVDPGKTKDMFEVKDQTMWEREEAEMKENNN